MTAQHPTESELRQEIIDLADAALLGELAPNKADRLSELICSDPRARQFYVEFIADSVRLQLARGQIQREPGGSRLETEGQEVAAPPTRSVSEESTPHAPREAGHRVPHEAGHHVSREAGHHAPREAGHRVPHEAAHHAERDGYYPQSPFRISTLAAVVAFVAIGILAYAFWPSPKQSTANLPAAKIANLMDAKWAGVSSQAGDTLNAGQQLLLQSGSVEITFNNQAKVIVEGPTELTIVDAAACRLATGRLTAHVPDQAKGFQVQTPSGTVTDLGTEFGVYVDAHADQQLSREEEQQPGGGPQQAGTQPPITEVHVFKGKVDVAPLSEEDSPLPNPKSEIPNPKSQILSAGQAATISDNKVQPLPAADPFKFALDKLQGRPRQVLLTEDFESYDVGPKAAAIGPWTVQTGTRKGQGVAIGDFDKILADEIALRGLPDPSYDPAPPSISRVLRIFPSAGNPTNTFPKVAYAIEAPQLAHTCQVLVEFTIFPAQDSIEPSFALAVEAGPTPGIEFWRNADPTAPPVQWKPPLVYRVRVLMDVLDGTLREARVERSQWRGAEGWVRDAEYRTPVAKVDWTTPPKFVIFGYPVATPQTPPGIFSIDNIRIEVIAEK